MSNTSKHRTTSDLERFEEPDRPTGRGGSPGHLVWAMLNGLAETGQSTVLAAMSESGLTLPQIVVLHVLDRGPATISTLADYLHLSLSATSSLVQRLVQEDLVSRDEDPADRRHKNVELTRKGTSLIDRIDRERAEGVVRGLSRLPAPLRAELLDVAKRVLAHLKERR